MKSRPAAFFHPSFARLVEVGNTEDDLEKLASCDLVVEAIIEKMEHKRALFERVEKVIGPDTVIASNTSGLRISEMMEGRSESFKKRFLVMHFFNPVRYMKLLELVVGPDTDPAVLERVRKFGVDVLGRDRRRQGHAELRRQPHRHARHARHDPPDDRGRPRPGGRRRHHRIADGPPQERELPHRGSRRRRHLLPRRRQLLHVAHRGRGRDVFKVPAYIRSMVEKKILGDKTKGGFYKKGKEGIETLDPKTLEYRAKGGDEAIKKTAKGLDKIEDVAARVKKLANDPGKAGSSRGRCSRAAWPTRRAASGRSPTASPRSMTR